MRSLTLLAIACLAVAGCMALLWVMQRGLIYFPDRSVQRPVDAGLPGADAVAFETEDGLMLGGWFVPAVTSPRITLLVFNGNAGNRAYRAPLAAALAAEGLQVLLMDYRGYGGASGSPTEEGLARDARAAQHYLTTRPDVDASRLVYFGESLGAAVAVRLAAERPPAALILRSPFTTLADVGAHHYPLLPVRWLLRDRFPSIDLIGRVRAPLLVVAGDRDGIVPIDQSRRLYDAAAGPKTWLTVAGADHNDAALLNGGELVRGVVRLLRPLT